MLNIDPWIQGLEIQEPILFGMDLYSLLYPHSASWMTLVVVEGDY
jgi:hypothetical protein